MASDPIVRKPKEKNFIGSMGIFTKLIVFIVVIAIVYVIWTTLTGLNSIWDFLIALVQLAVLVALLWLSAKGVMAYFTPKAFSPRDDNFSKLTEMARFYKPNNLKDLFFVGDVGKKRVKAGKIVGCLGIPYFTADFERDEKGKVLLTDIPDPTKKNRMLPKFRKIVANEGDTLFIIQQGFIFMKERFIRCNRKLHSTLNGDVEIFDINPYPYGRFEYPYKQVQLEPVQLRIQSMLETLLTTNEYQLDLISMGVDKALSFNPEYLMERKRATEQIQQ